MKVKIEIELNGSEDQELIQRVIGIIPQGGTTTVTAEPVKEKAAKQSKPEPAKEEKPEPKQAEEEKPEPEPVKEEKAKAATITVDAVRALLVKKVPVWREDIRKKLNSYGAGNFTNLSPEYYEEFYAYLQTLSEDGK